MRFTNKINFWGNIIKYKAKQFVTEHKKTVAGNTLYTLGNGFGQANILHTCDCEENGAIFPLLARN